jgi:hypothetical protein
MENLNKILPIIKLNVFFLNNLIRINHGCDDYEVDRSKSKKAQREIDVKRLVPNANRVSRSTFVDVSRCGNDGGFPSEER